MATLAMKIKAEQRMRELLAEAEVAEPDHVEYGYGCIRLFWDGPKVVVVVDIDEDGEIADSTLTPGGVEVVDAPGESTGATAEVFPMPPTKNGSGSHKRTRFEPRSHPEDEPA